jgi:CPA2 family monovalent cation:H+ antiporter-2
MIENSQYLFVVISLLTAAVIIVTTFRSIKVSPVLGYFVAGAAIGEYGLHLIPTGKGIDIFGEFGIVFLLFVIGLELTLDRLMSMRKYVFGFGTLQIVLTSSLFVTIFYYFFGVEIKPSLIIGGGLALSSTAIVIQVLIERSLNSTQVGRLSIGMLLMQDFAVIPLLVLLPILDNSGDKSSELFYSVALAFGKAILAFLIIFGAGKILLKPFFRMVASTKSDELFIAATLLIVLGAAFITDALQLSMALGAFMAGLMVAETEYAHDVEDVVLPFKGLLLGLFFMTVGMSIDFHLLLKHIWQILGYSIVITVVKFAIIYSLARIFKFNRKSAIQAGLMLAQGSEFAFILFGLAEEHNIIPTELSQIMMMTITFTMAITPLLAALGERIANFGEKDIVNPNQYILQETSDLANHVIIVGFGNTGKILANILISEYIYYVAIDINPAVVSGEKNNGYVIYKGDGTKIDIFKNIGIEKSSNIIITVPNMVTAKKISENVKSYCPDINITAKSYDLEDVGELISSGIDNIIPENYEVSIMLASSIMNDLGFNESEINSTQERLRFSKYKLIRENFINDEIS